MNDTTTQPPCVQAAEAAAEALPKLSHWLTVEQLQDRYKEHYRSTESLRWALRVHRPHLLRRHALSQVGGRLLVHPERFEAAVIDGGIEAAVSKAAA